LSTDDLVEEVGGGEGEQGRLGAQGDDLVRAEAEEEGGTVVRGGEQDRGRLRAQQGEWVWVEGEDGSAGAGLAGLDGEFGQEGGVAFVRAVEVADGHRQPPARSRYIVLPTDPVMRHVQTSPSSRQW